ncbi:FeoA family protein [Amedibacillus sp. YH-ame6]
MIPITMCSVNERFEIQRISGQDSQRQHLAELGFVVGTQICIVSKLQDNVIVGIRDGRIALDKTMANKIFVR